MALLLLILFIISLFLGTPIAICLGLSSLLTILITNKIPLMIVVQMIYAAGDSFALMAIPFFMLAGSLMEAGGLSKRLIDFANKLVGSVSGGLGIIVVITSMFFAAISGSGPATVAALGTILIPGMIKAGYERGYASALQATAGAIGIIIPPSIPMIVYGVQAEVSVSKMFLAGLLPGVVFGIALLALNYIISRKRNYRGTSNTSLKEILVGGKNAFFALLMPFIILGGIYGGIFTPTEASGVAVIYGLIIGMFIYKEIKISDLPRIFINASIGSAVVMFIVITASIFSFILVSNNVPNIILDIINGISQSKVVVLLLINVFLLIVGCFLDASSAIIVLTPLLLPLVKSFEVDPVHFGIIMVVNLAIGLITPPVGLDLYVACGISDIKIERISRAVLPFLVVTLGVLLFITFIPQISMVLPDILGFK